jgi:vacuolar protein-sorting-associated protein 4
LYDKQHGLVQHQTDDENETFDAKMQGAILLEKPNVHWNDLAGLNQAKETLIQTVFMPRTFPQLFKNGRKPWRGILLYGPPGTGKSFLAKACATELDGAAFFSLSAADLVSKWVGESAKLVAALFQKARSAKNSVTFIDEIDSLLSSDLEWDSESWRQAKTQFMVELDGVGKSMDGILLLAATNKPWALESAIRRRFEKRIYVPLPEKAARLTLLGLKVNEMNLTLTNKDIGTIADWTEGYSGADLSTLCQDAGMAAASAVQQAQYFTERNGLLYRCARGDPGAFQARAMDLSSEQRKKVAPHPVTINDFKAAVQRVRPSVDPSTLRQYEQWTAKFGQQGD